MPRPRRANHRVLDARTWFTWAFDVDLTLPGFTLMFWQYLGLKLSRATETVHGLARVPTDYGGLRLSGCQVPPFQDWTRPPESTIENCRGLKRSDVQPVVFLSSSWFETHVAGSQALGLAKWVLIAWLQM